jgi:hypothetical protein
MFTYITQAVRRILYCKQHFKYDHITCWEYLWQNNTETVIVQDTDQTKLHVYWTILHSNSQEDNISKK